MDYWLHICERSRIEVEMYSDNFLREFESCAFFGQCARDVEGKLSWNNWGNCDVSCGGGVRLRVAKSCVPDYALCNSLNVLEEPCNSEPCPDMPSTYLPPGTIISWVPRPSNSINETEEFSFNNDTWIKCDGIETCSQGLWAGQVCTDLSDRALIGVGANNKVLDLKDATLPDHAHKHRHTGSKSYSFNYKRGPDITDQWSFKRGEPLLYSWKNAWHNHNIETSSSVNVNFSDMNESEDFISKITNSKVQISNAENNLYPQHIRLMFMFKCF